MNSVSNIQNYFENFNYAGLLVSVGLILLKLLLIFCIYFIIKKISVVFISKLFETYTKKHAISSGRAYTLESLTKNILSYLLIFILAVTVLQTFGIDATAILAGAGIVGLAVGFGAQGLVSDIVTGFFLLLEKQLDVGDSITTSTFSGTVEQVGLRTTQLRSADGTLHFIPNREIKTLSNHSRGDMQALVDVIISNDNNIPQVLQTFQEECDKIREESNVITDGPNVIGIQSFASTSLTIRIVTKTLNNEQWGIERLIRQRMQETIDEKEIKLPSPATLALEKGTK
ncbi:mechanosensitive ion channel family protein [Niallia taxi]|uniref:mechanosensitive ion channel family protein n=1 Tax=Niallia taxi TaxID=2499688 RepID=UPI003D28C0B1